MSFFDKIKKFNEMYKMPENAEFDWDNRFHSFKDILQEEVDEGVEISAKFGSEPPVSNVDFKTELADWLGDIIVYCASEAHRWGIPIDQVLDTIMESNFSKLGADGKPIYDERGKLMKGPGYWKPEPQIRELLKGLEK